jgi:hypothetical protein
MFASKTNSEQLAGDLRGRFDLSFERTREPHFFQTETKYIHFGLNGKRLGVEFYVLKIEYVPKTENVDQYKCTELQLQVNDGPTVTVPELTNWVYIFNQMVSGADNSGPLWGILQDKFAKICDDEGKASPFTFRYAVYDNFIDFNITDIFARPTKFGKGIQELKEIGQRIVHVASFAEASVRFGAEIRPGSSFRNGEVSLELKGLSLVDGAPCALVAYNAGESSLRMVTFCFSRPK